MARNGPRMGVAMPEGREQITSNPPPDKSGVRAGQETGKEPGKNRDNGFVRQVGLVAVFLSIVGVIIYALARTRAGLG